ncbi:hypothetical protein CERSUDRAFT_73778 [Gelatoporia subvermispora B]|uniref:Uncharacterized protein n=1 Tax=Ceriporiopsis subvermispora (strain B) TaxID=914234 RepID=M2RE42_CERS8|nr:hypothetical protein CERSUDRAFT_73778 [Gelatoporia subvermispora B]
MVAASPSNAETHRQIRLVRMPQQSPARVHDAAVAVHELAMTTTDPDQPQAHKRPTRAASMSASPPQKRAREGSSDSDVSMSVSSDSMYERDISVNSMEGLLDEDPVESVLELDSRSQARDIDDRVAINASTASSEHSQLVFFDVWVERPGADATFASESTPEMAETTPGVARGGEQSSHVETTGRDETFPNPAASNHSMAAGAGASPAGSADEPVPSVTCPGDPDVPTTTAQIAVEVESALDSGWGLPEDIRQLHGSIRRLGHVVDGLSRHVETRQRACKVVVTHDRSHFPDSEELKYFDPSNGCECCDVHDFRPDFLNSIGTAWNRSITRVFVKSFLSRPGNEDLDESPVAVKVSFERHSRALRQRYLQDFKYSMGAVVG